MTEDNPESGTSMVNSNSDIDKLKEQRKEAENQIKVYESLVDETETELKEMSKKIELEKTSFEGTHNGLKKGFDKSADELKREYELRVQEIRDTFERKTRELKESHTTTMEIDLASQEGLTKRIAQSLQIKNIYISYLRDMREQVASLNNVDLSEQRMIERAKLGVYLPPQKLILSEPVVKKEEKQEPQPPKDEDLEERIMIETKQAEFNKANSELNVDEDPGEIVVNGDIRIKRLPGPRIMTGNELAEAEWMILYEGKPKDEVEKGIQRWINLFDEQKERYVDLVNKKIELMPQEKRTKEFKDKLQDAIHKKLSGFNILLDDIPYEYFGKGIDPNRPIGFNLAVLHAKVIQFKEIYASTDLGYKDSHYANSNTWLFNKMPHHSKKMGDMKCELGKYVFQLKDTRGKKRNYKSYNLSEEQLIVDDIRVMDKEEKDKMIYFVEAYSLSLNKYRKGLEIVANNARMAIEKGRLGLVNDVKKPLEYLREIERCLSNSNLDLPVNPY